MKDAIIVGGGLIGMLTTRTLQAAGMDVMLIERGELGRESSWAGGGIVSPLYPWRYNDTISHLAHYSQQHYPALCAELLEETGIDPQWARSGLLIPDDGELPAAKQWAQSFGYALQHLNSSYELRDCEPQLHPGFQRGLFLPELGQIRNPSLMTSLAASLRFRPVSIAEYAPVTGLIVENQRVTGVHIGNDAIKAGKVILASGAWTSLFPELQPLQVDIRPVLGQMILFRGKPGELTRIVLHGGRYLIPRRDGRILCGSTLEMEGFNKQTTETAREELRESACALMPALRDLPIANHWCGLRPGSPDGVPYIGEHPQIAGLYVNAGHYRNGVVLGLASVQLLTSLILGQKPCVDPAPYQLEAPREPTEEFLQAPRSSTNKQYWQEMGA